MFKVPPAQVAFLWLQCRNTIQQKINPILIRVVTCYKNSIIYGLISCSAILFKILLLRLKILEGVLHQKSILFYYFPLGTRFTREWDNGYNELYFLYKVYLYVPFLRSNSGVQLYVSSKRKSYMRLYYACWERVTVFPFWKMHISNKNCHLHRRV